MSRSFKEHCASSDVAVIGAGPYGLSAAAYLKAAGLQNPRISAIR